MFDDANTKMRPTNRAGFTLIEVMVALVMTLIVLVAMMQAFKYASTEIAKGRAMIEMSNQLRTAQETLRSDFDGLTVDMRPWAITAGPNGYFEYIEGKSINGNDASSLGTVNNVFGDLDDILAMTVRCDGTSPFRGRRTDIGGTVTAVESNVAEVIWWTDFEDRNGNLIWETDEPIMTFRRVLLVRPDLGNLGADPAFFLKNDISARFDGTNWIANSIDDLAKRENRFAHDNVAFPFILNRATLKNLELTAANLTAAGGGSLLAYEGQDVLISDVIAFDVKAFSPDTPIRQIDDIVITPADVPAVYVAAGVASEIDQGAFVDLAYAAIPFSPTAYAFSTWPTLKSQLNYTFAGTTDVVYDTFSKHYESNGIDEDDGGSLLPEYIDEGTDGFDALDTDGPDLDALLDDVGSAVDDNEERETLPPYPNRLTSVKVSIRLIERTTKQVRQTSVTTSFIPN